MKKRGEGRFRSRIRAWRQSCSPSWAPPRTAGACSPTPSIGFTSTTIAKAQLGELKIKGQSKADDWKVKLKTKGLSDLYVQSNLFTPGGSSGWHTHPGSSLITVTAGTVTVYDGDDPSCTPHVYSAGTTTNGFVDVGGGDIHLIRNEGTENARRWWCSSSRPALPEGSTRRHPATVPSSRQTSGGRTLRPPSGVCRGTCSDKSLFRGRPALNKRPCHLRGAAQSLRSRS